MEEIYALDQDLFNSLKYGNLSDIDQSIEQSDLIEVCVKHEGPFMVSYFCSSGLATKPSKAPSSRTLDSRPSFSCVK